MVHLDQQGDIVRTYRELIKAWGEFWIRLHLLTDKYGPEKAAQILGAGHAPGTEYWYNVNANVRCNSATEDLYGIPGCGGLGMIRYGYDVDESTLAPCIRCFPNDPKAKAGHQEWKENQQRNELLCRLC
jgi:hypothetical protein